MNHRQSVIDEIADKIERYIPPRPKAEAVSQPPNETRKQAESAAYYASDTNKYYLQNHRGHWIKYDITSLKRYLARVVYRHVSKKEGQDENIDDYIVNLQQRHDVTLAIPLAGYPIGIHMICGERLLVTKEASYIKPRAGEWGNLKGIIDTLLPGQQEYLYGWLKAAFRALRAGPPFRPGQLLSIAGPGGCGKSFLQNLITVLLGGRSADPYDYMMGYTNFNSELFYAEHLMIEDKAASTNAGDRAHFGSMIKTMLVNETQKLHRKASEALKVSPFWRGTMTMNNDPESLLVHPPIKEDIVDKIILLQASKAKFPYHDDDLEKRREFWNQCVKELPAFVSFLNSYRIPEAQKDQRFGVKAWQHPELIELLADLSHEASLLALIDELLPFDVAMNPFVGTAGNLLKKLMEKDKFNRVEKICKTSVWCGVYLARLAKTKKKRVIVAKRVNNLATWKINPPSVEADDKNTGE